MLLFHAFFGLTQETPVRYAVLKATAPFWIGVNVFFVLSGFLITGILMDTKAAPNYFWSFYARRTLRIFPIYFATLIAIFWVLPALHLVPWTGWVDQIGYWTYTYNWFAAAGHGAFRLVPFWTLAVEEQFYLVWPLVLFVTPTRRMPVLFLSLMAASFLFRVMVYVLGLPFNYDYFLTPARVEDLCFGALTAWLVRDSVWLPRLRPYLQRSVWVLAGMLVVVVAVGKGFEQSKWPALVFGTSLVCALSSLWILRSTEETRARWWGHPALRWMGTYSYGIYIFHQPIVNFVQDRLNDSPITIYAWGMVGAVLASCAAAWISFHGFERHFLRLKKRVRAEGLGVGAPLRSRL